jgi:hypothetical protein
MPHPVHEILKRVFDIEQYAFDANARELQPSERREVWPSERFVQAFVGDRGDEFPEPRHSAGVYLEREPES